MKKLIFSLLFACSAFGLSAKPTLLNIKETITDNSIVPPESFETDTYKMKQNWYLRNYTVLNDNFSNTPVVNATDDEYISRLSKLPTDIEMPYNQIVRSYIDMYVQRRRELVENMLGMSLYYMPIFEEALERKGLPLELKYLPVIESALNPDAVSGAGDAVPCPSRLQLRSGQRQQGRAPFGNQQSRFLEHILFPSPGDTRLCPGIHSGQLCHDLL